MKEMRAGSTLELANGGGRVESVFFNQGLALGMSGDIWVVTTGGGTAVCICWAMLGKL